jgi:hypothetical protein
MHPPEGRCRYLDQNSPQTLREAMAEYYRTIPDLLEPQEMCPGAEMFLRRHDVAHVVFGCDTTYRGETLANTWTVFGSTAGIRGFTELFDYGELSRLFAEVGWPRVVLETLRWIWGVLQVIARTWNMPAQWPWKEYELYLDRTLAELRRDFNIAVA